MNLMPQKLRTFKLSFILCSPSQSPISWQEQDPNAEVNHINHPPQALVVNSSQSSVVNSSQSSLQEQVSNAHPPKALTNIR